MRELKFRAWNIEEERMYQVSELAFYVSKKGKSGFDVGIRIDDVSDVLYFDPITELKPMQYTGQKGKNGKEIYEGDFVQFEDEDGDVLICVVEWDDAGENETLISGFRWRKIKDVTEEIYKYGMLNEPPKDWTGEPEVIGNIYENPGLL